MAWTQRRESVLDDVRTDVAAIDGTGNYFYSAGRVSRNMGDLTHLSASHLPAAIIVPQDSIPEPKPSNDYETPLGFSLVLVVRGRKKPSDESEVPRMLEKWYADVVIAVMTNQRRSGYARRTEHTGFEIGHDPSKEHWVGQADFLALIDHDAVSP